VARPLKSQSGSKGGGAPEVFLVDDPRPLLARCKRVLEAGLPKAGKMGFNMQGHARGESEYLLNSDAQSWARARNQYPVLPLLTTVGSAFWFAVALRFGPALGRFQLKHVSVLIFEGLASDPNKAPLVRAEWDETDITGPHAQPHWHVYPSALTRLEPASFEDVAEAPASLDETALDETAEESQRRRLEGERFHYAMSATWHLDGGGHQSRLSEDELLRWLPGCILYSQGQLAYLSGR
jgi:hypothetical protein